MNKPTRFLMALASLAVFGGLVISASAQQSPNQQTAPSAPSAQQPNETPQTPPAHSPQPPAPAQTSPDPQAQTPTSNGQTFSGTVVKSGDKYILQMADGTAYDLDHQDLVKKYEGKQVRVKGTLDPDGKMIHITP